MIRYEKYLKIALDASDKVGKYLLQNFGDIKKLKHKTEKHYGIEEDKESNIIYKKILKKMTPEIDIYSEEDDKKIISDKVWIIDPIEGTSNYRAGIPFFATQLGLLIKGDPIISTVNIPAFNQRFYAVKGKGAYLNEKRVFIGKETEIKRSLVAMEKGTSEEDAIWYANTSINIISKVRTIRVFGACGIDLSYLAAGGIDIFIGKGSQIYDYIPGSLIIREAGGVIKNFAGEPWTINDDEFVASNRILSQKLLEILV